MRTEQKYIWLIARITLFASCQSPKQVLSKSDSRMKIMVNIASDHEMSKEIMDAIILITLLTLFCDSVYLL